MNEKTIVHYFVHLCENSVCVCVQCGTTMTVPAPFPKAWQQRRMVQRSSWR